jgi:hypothetical protein
MTMLNDARLWQEAQARAQLQQVALHRAQQQRLLAQLTAALVRPQEPLSGPAITRALRTQPGWCVLRLVYADDTLHVQVARRADPPQGGLIWARWRPLRVVVRGWLHYRRTPQGLYAPVAEAWELVGAAPGAGRGG